MKSLTLPLSKIKLNDDNPRLIKDGRFAQLVKSLQEFPEMLALRPLVVDESFTVLGGNMRLRAMQHLHYTEALVTVAVGLTDAQKREFVIKDNGSFGEHDWDALANGDWPDAATLNDWGVEIPTDWGVVEELPAAEEGEPDLTPPSEPVTVLGDLYELNKHRIQCGDSCDIDVVDKTLNGAEPLLMITDPPYGVEYDADWRNEAIGADGEPVGGRAVGKVLNDDNADWSAAWAISPAKVAYVYHDGLFAGVVATSLQDCDFQLRSQIIWAKSNFAISRGHYHWKHEPCYYAVKKGSSAKFIGDHTNHTIWEIAKPSHSESGHSTQKPVECMAKPIRNHEGDVYDPFLGSHTTLIACEQEGRTCYGQELNPAYTDVGVRRWLRYMADNNRPATVKRNGTLLTPAELAEFTPA